MFALSHARRMSLALGTRDGHAKGQATALGRSASRTPGA